MIFSKGYVESPVEKSVGIGYLRCQESDFGSRRSFATNGEFCC